MCIRARRFVRVAGAIALICASAILGGCVKARLNAAVDTTGGAVLDYTVGVNLPAQALTAVGADPLSGVRDRLTAEGFAIAGWSEGDYKGFRATKRVDRLTTIPGVSAEGDHGLSFSPGLPFDVYRLDGKVKLDDTVPTVAGAADAAGLGAEAKSALSDQLVSQADVEFTVVLPIAAGTTNASEISLDRRTLTWKLVPGQVTDLQAEASSVGVVGVVGMMLTLVLLAGAVFLVVRARRRRELVEVAAYGEESGETQA